MKPAKLITAFISYLLVLQLPASSLSKASLPSGKMEFHWPHQESLGAVCKGPGLLTAPPTASILRW